MPKHLTCTRIIKKIKISLVSSTSTSKMIFAGFRLICKRSQLIHMQLHAKKGAYETGYDGFKQDSIKKDSCCSGINGLPIN